MQRTLRQGPSHQADLQQQQRQQQQQQQQDADVKAAAQAADRMAQLLLQVRP